MIQQSDIKQAEIGQSEITTESEEWIKIYDRQNGYAWILSNTTVAIQE